MAKRGVKKPVQIDILEDKSKPSLLNFKFVSLKPNFSNLSKEHIDKETLDELNASLPTVHFAESCSFEVHNVSQAMANGIRRTLKSEILVKCLDFDTNKFKTTEPYALFDFIHSRIKQIPISQDIPDDAKYKLDITNNTDDMFKVETRHLEPLNKSAKDKYMNETFTIIEMLTAGTNLKIDEIYVVSNYNWYFGGFTAVSKATCLPLDQKPLNLRTGEGISSSVSNPRKHKISINTNGTIRPDRLVTMALDEIIKRLNKAKDLIGDLQVTTDQHLWIIKGETDTIGHIITRSIFELNPEIPAVTYDTDENARLIKIKIKTKYGDDPKLLVLKAIDYSIDIFRDLKTQIKKFEEVKDISEI